MSESGVGAAVTAVQRPRRVRPNYAPYLLLLPGLAWLVVFFVVPTLSLASQSLQTGNVETGYSLTWHFQTYVCLLYTSPSPRDGLLSRMPSSA